MQIETFLTAVCFVPLALVMLWTVYAEYHRLAPFYCGLWTAACDLWDVFLAALATFLGYGDFEDADEEAIDELREMEGLLSN